MYLWIFTLGMFLGFGRAQQNGSSRYNDLPFWLTSNPAFNTPKVIDSTQSGRGSINSTKTGNLSWLVNLNNERGYGIEILLKNLTLNPNSNDYLIMAAWPVETTKFREIKLFTGRFAKSRKLHIPNSKSFFVLISSTHSEVSEMDLSYTRYGVSYEIKPATTESPVKKETLYEVSFKGRSPKDYYNVDFQRKLKESIRAIAKRFCLVNQIKFDDNITTNEMVFINRISFCPFEWPDRDICAFIEHYVFVSGVRIPDEFMIMDFQLTAENLNKMWMQGNHPELEKLGVTIYHLPDTSYTVLWWTIIIGVAVLASIVGIIIFWKIEKHSKDMRRTSSTKSSVIEAVRPKKKFKLKLAPHQQIPAFMYRASELEEENKKLAYSEHKFGNVGGLCKEEVKRHETCTSPPIQNYFGSILFSSNKAFEDDEEVNVEFPPAKEPRKP